MSDLSTLFKKNTSHQKPLDTTTHIYSTARSKNPTNQARQFNSMGTPSNHNQQHAANTEVIASDSAKKVITYHNLHD